ncbi:MAG: helix-turn-helix transcriptional regulator [Nitrososphaerales archaeon]|nr:helix-turn-helix transcriptional regulator [Nitrososphaerales archaeon]
MDELKAKAKLSGLVSPEILEDVTRLRIMKMLSLGERCACEIIKSQPRALIHLNMLEKEGIVKKREEGFLNYYSLAKPKIARLLADL